MSDSNGDTPNSLETFMTPNVIGFIGTDILFKVLRPFVEKRLKDAWGDNWRTEAVEKFKKKGKKLEIINGEINWDLVALLDAIILYWTELIDELRGTRNEIMHNDPFPHERAEHALGTMIHLMQAINGGEDAVQKLTTLRQLIGATTSAVQLSEKKPAAQRPKKKPAAQRPKKKKDADYYFNQGSVNYHESNYQEAIENYTQAIKLDPNNAYAYFNRGVAKAKLKGYPEAIKDYTEAIRLDPNSAEAYYNRGGVKSDLGDYQEARKDYDKAIEIDPKNAPAYNNRGIAKALLKDYQGAIQDLTEAIRLHPKSAQAYYNRGNAKALLEDYQGAIKDFTKAIRLHPIAAAYENRGSAKRSLGDLQGAIKDFEKAKELRKKK